MSIKLNGYQSFEGNCAEAFVRYKNVFQSKIAYLCTYGEQQGMPEIGEADKKVCHKKNILKYLFMKNFNPILLLLCSLFSLTVYSQNEKPHREAFDLKLAVDSVHYYEQVVKESPYFVKDMILQIYPGERLLIEVELKGNEIISMKSVKENEKPAKTIEIDFKQNTSGRESETMILMVNNPFKKELTYEAMMYIVGHDKFIETSIAPIKAGIPGFEIWYDAIITLVLKDWKLN